MPREPLPLKREHKGDIIINIPEIFRNTEIQKEVIKVCTISHKVDRVILTDVQITGKYQVDDLIEFLQNLKPSLTH